MKDLFSKDFYPTPERVAADMLAGLDFYCISSILEPSAGKGDLADAAKQRMRAIRSDRWNKVNWDKIGRAHV